MSQIVTDGAAPAVSRRRRRGDGRLAVGYLAPGMTGFLAFVVLPVIGSFAISFFRWPLWGDVEFVGLSNYGEMLGDPVFWRALRNTTVFTLSYAALNLIIAVSVAVWLNTMPRRWAATFRVLFFVPVVVPMVANAMVWRLMLQDDGVVNSALAFVGIQGPSWLGDGRMAMVSLVTMALWQGMGYNIVILGAALNQVDPSIIEASALDGATGWRRFWAVTFPLLSPAVFFCLIMTVMGAFKVFTEPYALTNGGPADATNTLVLYLYRLGFSYGDLGYASSLAWALFVLVMLVTGLQFAGQKKWVHYDS